MKESYDEGIASRIGLESCVGVRKGVGEALTEVRIGWVLSPERSRILVPTPFPWCGRQYCTCSISRERVRAGRDQRPHACAETPCESRHGGTSGGNGLRFGSREVPGLTAPTGVARAVKPSLGYDGDARSREVGWVRSTREVLEQGLRCAAGCGEDGGKEPSQWEPVGAAQHRTQCRTELTQLRQRVRWAA